MEPIAIQEIKNVITEDAKAPAEPEKPTEQTQPWKKILDQIDAVNKNQPLGGDFFVCKDGFYSHSLAA